MAILGTTITPYLFFWQADQDMGINPITALFWTSVINGLLAPPILVVVVLIANNKAVLGKHVNGPLANTIGWVTTAAMFAAALALALTWTRG